MADANELKQEILKKTAEFYKLKKEEGSAVFKPGESPVNYAGRVYDEKEMTNLVDASLDFWLTAGPYAQKFEEGLAKFLGVNFASLVNSGSSANLLAVSALTSPKLGDRQLRRGDEIITVACGFPTTVAPIIQNGLVPVFVDVELPTYNINCEMLEAARSGKTKGVMLAHTLGNPFNLDKVKSFCDKYGLWLIEDNCDALGSKYNGKLTGTFGDVAAQSFYPPHHITMGEGGAVATNNPALKMIINSFRDWGRDCWCASGRDNTCGKRFNRQFDEMPMAYDHKYIYSHFGYNLKATDLQAAIGLAQLEKLPAFTAARRKNFSLLYDGLKDLERFFILPRATENSEPSWFGFILTVRDDAGFSRDEIVSFLEDKKIQTRMLFAGNMLRQPCFDEMRRAGNGYRMVESAGGGLPVTDRIMKNTFWIGVYPGLNGQKIQYMIEKIKEFTIK